MVRIAMEQYFYACRITERTMTFYCFDSVCDDTHLQYGSMINMAV